MKELTEGSPIELEIVAERASAYFTTARKMQAALAALVRFDQQPKLAGAAGTERRREDLVAEAAEQAWFFVIQREAMKLPYYEELFADFDIPDEVRKRMGPKLRPSRRP